MTWGGRWWVGSELKSRTRAGHPQWSPTWHWNPCALWWKKTALNDRSLVEIRCVLEYLVNSTFFSIFVCLPVFCFVLFHWLYQPPKRRAVMFQLRLFRLPIEILCGITTMSSDVSHADWKVCLLWTSSLCKRMNISGVEKVNFWKLKPGIIPPFFIFCIWNYTGIHQDF